MNAAIMVAGEAHAMSADSDLVSAEAYAVGECRSAIFSEQTRR
jgi:hypothetical protein